MKPEQTLRTSVVILACCPTAQQAALDLGGCSAPWGTPRRLGEQYEYASLAGCRLTTACRLLTWHGPAHPVSYERAKPATRDDQRRHYLDEQQPAPLGCGLTESG